MQDVSCVRFPSRPLNHQTDILTVFIQAACFVPHTSEACDRFALFPSRLEKLLLCLSSSQPHWTLKFASGASRGPLQATLFHETRLWPGTAYAYGRQVTGQREHDLLPNFSHTWACARCTFERAEHQPAQSMSGESHPEGAVSTIHCCLPLTRKFLKS